MLCLLMAPLRAQEQATVLARAETAGTGFYNISPEAGLMAYATGNPTAKWSIVLVSLKTGKPSGKLAFPKELAIPPSARTARRWPG